MASTSQNSEQAVTPYGYTPVEVVPDESSTALALTPQQIAAVRLDSAAKRYGTMAEEVRRSWLRFEIGKLMVLRGMEIDKTMVSFHAAGLDDMIMQEYDLSQLTLPEIDAALKAGLAGRYGEVYGVAASGMIAWLNGYMESEAKQEATAIVRAKLESIRAAEKKAAAEKARREIENLKASGEYVPNPRGWWKTDTTTNNNKHQAL